MEQAYLKKIDELFEKTELSYFELNLETWRQLWRVLEMSDILLCIVDIRFPVSSWHSNVIYSSLRTNSVLH